MKNINHPFINHRRISCLRPGISGVADIDTVNFVTQTVRGGMK